MDEIKEEVVNVKESREALLTASMERELTDEQLLELAEGGCTWGTGTCQ
jgi:hypothetical protein